MRFLHILALSLLLLLFSGTLSDAQLVQIESAGGKYNYLGTGFIVAKGKGKTCILTACHVIRGTSPIIIKENGVNYLGTIYHDNWPYDLVLIRVEEELVGSPLVAAKAVYAKHSIVYRGYAGGDTLTTVQGKVIDVEDRWLYGTGVVKQGMSGGPITDDGHVVGIISATVERGNESHGASLSILRPLMDRGRKLCGN